MALSREQIIDAALAILRAYGLGDLSMRRLARDLEVQPGALYWHVKNKQELLGVLAERILAPVAQMPDGSAPADAALVDSAPAGSGPAGGGPADAARRTAVQIRAALLDVRDGADVVSLAQALDPESLAPIRLLQIQLTESGLAPQQASWGARTLTHFILGAVAEEQTHAELAGAGLAPAGYLQGTAAEAFAFGVDTILRGLRPA